MGKRIAITLFAAVFIGTALLIGIEATMKFFGWQPPKALTLIAFVYVAVGHLTWVLYPRFERYSGETVDPGELP